MAIVSDAAQSPGDIMRRLVDLERLVQEMAAARTAESTTIGAGGITVQGGEIRITDPTGTVTLALLSSDGIEFNGQPLLFPGSVSWFAGPLANVPDGWLVCDGSAVSRTTYAELFAEIGTTWGVGNGTTTFNIPDLRDRVPIGAGSTYAVGATGGATTPTSSSESSHTHTQSDTGSESAHTHTQGNTGSESAHTHTQGNTGSEAAHTHAVDDITSSGAHTHGIAEGTDGTTTVTPSGATTVSLSNHDHDDIASSGSHTHVVAATDAGSSHAHTNPTTSGGSSHAHTNPTTSAGSSHSHTNPTTAAGSSHSHTVSVLQPYGALIPIIRF